MATFGCDLGEGRSDEVGAFTSIGGASPTLQEDLGESKQRETVAAHSRGGEGERTREPEGRWDGPPEENPNIQYHSWGFGGVARRITSDDASTPSCHSREGGNLKKSSRPSPDKPGNPNSEGAVAGSSRDSRLRENDTGGKGRPEATDYAAEILRLPLADRPICPYEQTEYNTAVTDALQRLSGSRIGAYGRHIVHMLALAQVMVSRAGLALREAQFTESVEVRSDNYNMTTTKVTAALSAYEKLERAWRRLLNDFERRYSPWGDYEADAVYEQRIQSDYDLADTPGNSERPSSTLPETRDRLGGTRSRASADEGDLVPPTNQDPITSDPAPQGEATSAYRGSRLRGNDEGEGETGGPSSTLADTNAPPVTDCRAPPPNSFGRSSRRSAFARNARNSGNMGGTRSRVSAGEGDLVPRSDRAAQSSAEGAEHSPIISRTMLNTDTPAPSRPSREGGNLKKSSEPHRMNPEILTRRAVGNDETAAPIGDSCVMQLWGGLRYTVSWVHNWFHGIRCHATKPSNWLDTFCGAAGHALRVYRAGRYSSRRRRLLPRRVCPGNGLPPLRFSS
ncbi:MAG: hypothetical protein IID09_09375 [Candidatus Hydrogenedentes bacterium]|nr:hypothetical protein [Candidatus Hydrogenedentota bacterium]